MRNKYSFILVFIFFISLLSTYGLYTNFFSNDRIQSVSEEGQLDNPMKGDLKIRRDVAHHLYLKLNSKDKDRKLVESELINYVRANWSLEQVTLLNLYTEDLQSTAFEEKVNQVRKSRNDTTNFHNQDFRFSDYKSLSIEGVDNEKLLEIAIGLESTDLVMYCDLVPDEEVAPPVDVPPTTYTFNQNYLGGNPGVNAKFLWDLGITGQDVTVGDIEYNVNLNHEEWAGEDKVVLADGLIPLNNSHEDHGTAVAGIVVAPDNGYGVTGIAHGIERFVFFSEVSRGSLGRAYLIQKAITQLKESDILIYEMQTWGAQGGFGPAEYSKTVWDATRAAVDAGLIVVAAAGNGNENLDAVEYTAYRNRGNSGAIIVGAGSASIYHSKLGFSTYGSRVDLQGWGEYVMTTGYSTYKFGNDHNQSYTTSFNGTSSATPIVASSIALVQSFAKNKLGKTMTSSEILELLRSTGHAQGNGGNIGPFPNLEAAIKKLTNNDSYGLAFKELKNSNGNELTELVKNEDLTIVFELTNYTNSSLRDLDFDLSVNQEIADKVVLQQSNVTVSRLNYYETKSLEYTFRLKGEFSSTDLTKFKISSTYQGKEITATKSFKTSQSSKPVITTISDQVLNEGQSLNLQVSATDSDFPKQNLTYSLDQSSENLGITINQTGLMTWTTNETHGGQNVTVTISVTDGELISNESFTLTINEVNNRPQITAILNQLINEGESLNLQVLATDSDFPKQNLTYSLDQSSENLGITISQTGLITWTTNENHGGQNVTVTVSVTDGELISNESFTLTINEGNNRPQITTISDQVLNEGESLNLQVLAIDSDFPKQNLTYSLDQSSENLGITINQTGLITWTTNEVHGGQNVTVTISVTDGELISNESFTLTINEVNNRPQITAIPNQVLNEGESLNLQVLAIDSDLPKQNLTYSLDQSSENLGITISQNGLITFTTNETHGAQSFNVAVSVSDGELSSSESFNVQVNKLSKPNSKPVITTISDQVLNEGESLNLQVSATDSDFPKQNLTYSLDQSSENLGITINQTGLITWTTNETHGGQNVTATVSVTDGELSSSESFTLRVIELNSKPVITAIPNQVLNEGESLNLQVSATDSDFPKQNLTYSLDQNSLNLGISIDQNGLITFTTNETHGAQSFNVAVSVSDGELSSSESFNVQVNKLSKPNSKPVITAIPNQVLNEGESLNLQVLAIDSDLPNQTLSYSLDQNSLNLGISINQNGLITWTTNETHGAQDFNVAVSVSDGELSSSESFNVQVNKLSKPNSKPVITAISDQVLNEGESLNLQVLAIDSDFPKQNLTYSLDQNSLNLGISIDQNGLITFTTNETHGAQSFNVAVSVSDGELSSSESFTLRVIEPNSKPVITAISDQVLNEGESLNLQVLAIDSDFPKQNLTYSLDQNSLNLGISIDQNGLITFTTNETHGAQSFNVAVSVSDGELSSSESFTLRVIELNSKPVITAISDQFLNEGESLNLQVLAIDSDFPKQNLTYSLDQNSLNLGISIDQNGLITWTTNETHGAQSFNVAVSVSDGELSSSESFTLRVIELNSKPVITAISDQFLNEGESLNLQVSATDSDFPKQNLTYSLDQNSLNLGISIDQNGLITFTTNETHGAQSFNVAVSVSDGELSSSESFNVQVNKLSKPNSKPVITAIPNQVLNEGESLNLQVLAIDSDLPNQTLSYSLDQNSLNLGISINQNGLITWTTNETHGAQSFNVAVSVSDGKLNSVKVFSIKVEAKVLNSVQFIYSNAQFMEAESNDGSIKNETTIDIVSDLELTTAKLIEGKHFNIIGLPEGLQPMLKVVNGSLKFSLESYALQHQKLDGTNKLRIEFLNEIMRNGESAELRNQMHIFEIIFKNNVLTNDNRSVVEIYPNPIKDRLFINSEEKISSVMIYNLDGNLVLEEKDKFKELDLAYLESGIYLVLIKLSGSRIERFKIVKE